MDDAMPDQGNQNEERIYSGRGWNLLHFQTLPEQIVAPLTVFATLILIFLFGVGIFLIEKLVERVWNGGADTVPAASAALTAIAAIFGAIFLTWRSVVAHWQARASQDQAATFRESHYTTLFTRAVELLGATRDVKETLTNIVDADNSSDIRETVTRTEPNWEVRLGAIYAMERIARDSERDHWPIMEVLTAYIRNQTALGITKSIIPEDKHRTSREWLATLSEAKSDVIAAMNAIGRRPEHRLDFEKKQEFYLDLSKSRLKEIGLSKVDFSDAKFFYTVLYRAHFIQANFERADFYQAILPSARFMKSSLNRTSFDGADLSETSFIECDLEFSSFSSAKLFRTNFLGTRLKGAQFFDANLYDISGVTSESLENTLGDSSTILSDKLVRPGHWPNEQLEWKVRSTWIEKFRSTGDKHI